MGQIQQRNEAEETYRPYFNAAARCQTQISSMAENESLAQRYTVVLEERKHFELIFLPQCHSCGVQ
jgi:galactonate dehydratase